MVHDYFCVLCVAINFVSRVACGKWEIFCCQTYLWVKKFFWIYYCITIKEILEYWRSIHQLRRWSQERFWYGFATIHRIASIMRDVDVLSCHIDILIHRTLFKYTIYEVIISYYDHLIILMILLTLVLMHVLSLSPTQLLLQKYLPLFLRYLLFIILSLIFLQTQLYNHIPLFYLNP